MGVVFMLLVEILRPLTFLVLILNMCSSFLFATAGLLASISAILLTARLGSGNASAANGLEFDVIAGVVIGGAALSGGRGTMLGTVLGVYVITVIGNGLVLLGINPFFQEVVRGVIIVMAVLINIAVTKRTQKSQE